ncbi:PREDICTED: homeobox-leucine zipper protein HOX11-like [Ipomoea nil]|uniref:homeobox-leucine zipper protein HOX11-like n=1 Tax=Ipomoea nil TaxID=35883 RepID=UPI00090183D8|nr:PREDICTED: homeobox-leucine zipper protein HOX11-like [Ipomoea nil]
MELGLSLGLGITAGNERLGRQEDGGQEPEKSHRSNDSDEDDDDVEDYDHATSSEEEAHRSADRRLAIFAPPVPLDLLPPAPVQKKNVSFPAAARAAAAEEVSSPNSVASSFRAIDFSIFKRNRNGAVVEDGGRDQRTASDAAGNGGAAEPASRASDEDENGVNARKKLRLSKEQSAYLEESFKEHHTLNPKQKHALAKQLNLRPRQVEVWFQNRRARTKLKQTEVDCEYLKRCCETLREENRRLHKELQELRALKSSNPFYMHLPATTLTMCPSCEKVASTSTAPPPATVSAPAPTTPTTAPDSIPKPIPFLSKPRFFPFTAAHNPSHPHQSAAS